MSSIAASPNPYLVAILLVCNTRNGSGAQIVFQYPPQPVTERSKFPESYSTLEESDSSGSGSDQSSSDDGDALFGRSSAAGASRLAKGRFRSVSDGDEHDAAQGRAGTSSVRSSTLFGLAEDGLVGLLAPDRAWHKRKFELSINDLTFVGRPVFVKHEGSWSKKKRSKARQANLEEPASDTVSASEDNPSDTNVPRKNKSENAPSRVVKSQLTMFHVVFVMNPPPLEHGLRVKDMYDHVVKKFSRALRWEQVHNDFVWQQCEIIVSKRTSAASKRMSQTQLWGDILASSSLATAISTVYDAIANSRIASVNLSPKISVSLQIPPVTSTAYLPSAVDPPIQPGLWLTTATDLATAAEDDASSSTHAQQMSKHYTLLLKAPPHRIAKEAQEAGGILAQHLPKFLAALRPTKSFYKLSVSSQISLADVQLLARHLVYWRRAIVIPLLHQRDTYIVSPNANLAKLGEASRIYEQQFPATMPSLPKILSALSGIPRLYGSLIPSKDHKEVYYFVLAWLMRNGWVTQLRTFAYVRVNPSIKRQVRDIEREQRIQHGPGVANRDMREEASDGQKLHGARPSMVNRPSSDGKKSLDGFRSVSNLKSASLILNPPRASVEESKWLDCIYTTLLSERDSALKLSAEERIEVQTYWPAFIKYFNGRVALETIPIRENLKRKFVWALLERLGMPGPNRELEDEDSRSKQVLLTIRHW